MIFETGDLIVLGILTILILVFRQFDKNNRSLEKVRTYADKVRSQLDEIVQEKREAIKDLSIDIDIQEKTDKEILKRVEAARGEMVSHAESIDTFNEKVTIYNDRVEELVAMTSRIDENLVKIKNESEYVDSVGKRISESLRKIQLLEKAMGALQDEFVKQNKKNLDNFQDEILSSSEERIKAVENKLSQSDQMLQSFQENVNELDTKHNRISEEKLALFANEMEKIRDQYNQYLEDIAEKGLKLESDVFTELNDSINTTADRIEENWKSGLKDLKESVAGSVESIKDRINTVEESIKLVESDADIKTDEIKESLARTESEVNSLTDKVIERTGILLENHEKEAENRLNIISGRFNDHEEQMEKHASEILGRCKMLITEHEQDSSALLDKIRTNMSEVTSFSHSIENQMSEFKVDIDKETEVLSEKLNSISEAMSENIDAKAVELETGLIKSVEDKVGEYEQSVSRRFDKLDGFMEDLDNLEENLKISLKEAVASVERDFEIFNENLMEERAAFKNSLHGDTEDIRFQMGELEKGLEVLKSQAYENVSEKLKVFEDEFFSDLTKRGNAMQSNLEEWQKNIDFKMDEIELKGTRDRNEMQQFCSADMKVKLNELQSTVYQQFEQFKSQVQDFRDSMNQSISASENEMKQFNLSVKEEVEGLKENSAIYFEEQFNGFKSSVAERFEKADKTIEIKFDEVVSDLDISRKELNSGMERSQSELAAWNIKIDQQIRDQEISLTDQVQTFKTDLTENISIIRDDFRNQREELIVSTNEERANLKREIQENGNKIEELNKELERSSIQAMDRFKSEYDDFILDFQRKTHEFQSDSELHAKDIRQGLVDTREKVDALQKKLFGRIEDDYNLITNNLKDIESKQQDFIAQTQIFERADSLKESLSIDIETLKDQISQIERSTSEAFRIKEEFINIHHLNEDIQSKLSKVMSEKQKIDTMDERINKIISLSDSVNLKLDEISSTHDTLQDYQVRLRQIEDLQDTTDKRFSRLEKKNALIDSTTEGVDKNFQILGTIEKAINTVKIELVPIFDNLKDVRAQHTKFQSEHDKIKSVIEKLATLDSTISELDGRIEAMNKAREWVASTESRIDSIGKKAREQVQLFGKLMEKEGRPGERTRKQTAGSPDMEVREMVLRLAHEGWKSEEIARTTKLSQGEVELILELSPKFSRK
jgi:chromosome segregation ATPase